MLLPITLRFSHFIVKCKIQWTVNYFVRAHLWLRLRFFIRRAAQRHRVRSLVVRWRFGSARSLRNLITIF
jgi:hypothetical protein